MEESKYIGHSFQLYGKEEYVLTSGRAQGMKIWHVKNGLGLEMCVSLDRCFDIVSLTYKGLNVGYLTPNGYVSSKYYDDKDDGFLKSFSAGFMTTCGLTQVGSPNEDEGEVLPLHGTISNTPVVNANYYENEDELILEAVILDERIFKHKLKLTRKIIISRKSNSFKVCDEVENKGDSTTPLEILYHINIGYPFLDENTHLSINSNSVKGRNEWASKDIESWALMHAPKANFEEKCYYHQFDEEIAEAIISNERLNKSVRISFNTSVLPFLTEWKMLGIRDYVLGVEPGNCTPDGRNEGRKQGWLQFIKPDEKKHFQVQIDLLDE